MHICRHTHTLSQKGSMIPAEWPSRETWDLNPCREVMVCVGKSEEETITERKRERNAQWIKTSTRKRNDMPHFSLHPPVTEDFFFQLRLLSPPLPALLTRPHPHGIFPLLIISFFLFLSVFFALISSSLSSFHISLFYVFFFSSSIQVQPTNQQTNYAVCIPQFHLPSVCLPLHLSPSALCCSFVFKQLGAEWPWLERELLCSFGQLVLHSVNKDSSGLVLGAQQHCNMDTFLIKRSANKELSIIQGGKTLDLYLRLNQQTDMLLLQNTSRQYQKLICWYLHYKVSVLLFLLIRLTFALH